MLMSTKANNADEALSAFKGPASLLRAKQMRQQREQQQQQHKLEQQQQQQQAQHAAKDTGTTAAKDTGTTAATEDMVVLQRNEPFVNKVREGVEWCCFHQTQLASHNIVQNM